LPPGDIAKKTQKRIDNLLEGLEFGVDSFHDGLHKLGQYQEAAERVAARVLKVSADRLEEREKHVKEASGTGSLGVQEVLRSLSRLDR
jgi:kinetochore protein Mis13/DSN1